jgi:hypothetical protein
MLGTSFMNTINMKTGKLTLIFGFLLITSLAFGQDYAFKVLANKGTNEVKSGDTWTPLKTGASLRKGDELKLSNNGYVGLVHSTGKPMEVKQAGAVTVDQLEKQVGAGGTSVISKYTDFILSSNSAEAKKNRLSATGAVHRAVEDTPIKLMLPENQHSGIYNNVAVISWDGSKVDGPYVVVIKNMFEDQLAKAETPETSLQIDLSDPRFANASAILVEVSSKSDPKLLSKQHMIKKLAPIEQDKVKTSLNEIIGQVSEQTALNKLILAGFYEENNLFIDAIAAYEDAIKLAPDVSDYKDAYEEFLLRHGLKR